jgi:hypothetical protein
VPSASQERALTESSTSKVSSAETDLGLSAYVKSPTPGYEVDMDAEPPTSDPEENMRSELGQTVALLGMTILVILAGLVIGLAI